MNKLVLINSKLFKAIHISITCRPSKILVLPVTKMFYILLLKLLLLLLW